MNLVLSKFKNKVCTLTINRPEQYNALDIDVLKELDAQFDAISNQKDCRAIILTGMGDKAFIAGADIKAMSRMDINAARKFSKFGQDLTVKMEGFEIPDIAAVNGYALGWGCEFAMACHIRYASDNAVFGQPEVGIGLIAGFGGTQRLPGLVGKGRALEILLSGNSISANEACAMGLVNKVFPITELISASEKLAESIAENAPISIRSTIKLVNNRTNTIIQQGLLKEQDEFADLFTTDDTAEGLAAFIEKRKPEFTGK